jgi:hypothetical protein
MNAASPQDIQHVDEALNKLSEHFDSVHIFVSRHEGQKGTIMVNKGTGNGCAQLGQIQDYMTRMDEMKRMHVRIMMSQQPPEEGE